MPIRGYAFFVYHPRCLDDLRRPHFLEAESEYTVVSKIQLNPIDFENFLTDMLVDRWFIEKYGPFCTESNQFHCLLTYCNTYREAIPILPESNGHIKFAACIPYSPK